jgi:hypothetical protein
VYLKKLKKVITTTFKNRSSDISYSNTIFSDTFKSDGNKNVLWNAFIKRNKLEEKQSFADILNFLQKFIQPILCNINRNKIWNPAFTKWQ